VRRRAAKPALELAREVRGTLESHPRGDLTRARAVLGHQLARALEANLADVAHRAGAGDGGEPMREVRRAHRDLLRERLDRQLPGVVRADERHRLEDPRGILRGARVAVTAQETRIECFFPVDDETRAAALAFS